MTKGRTKPSMTHGKGSRTTKNKNAPAPEIDASEKPNPIEPSQPFEQKQDVNKNAHTKTHISNGITVPEGYAVESTVDVVRYIDSDHTNVSRFIKNGHKKGSNNGLKGNVKVESFLVSSLITEEPQLKILDPGDDLEELPPNIFKYFYPWGARHFAHDFSSNFSSPQLCTENQHVGTVDFISDWKNIKALLKSSNTNNHLSFLLHRVGDSVTIDEHDLLSATLFPNFLQLPAEFVDFTHQVVGTDMEAVKSEGKSNEIVLAKEAFSRVLHRNMGTPMQFDLKASKKSDFNFLHRFKISMKNLSFLVGTNIPLYSHANKSTNTDPQSVTVRGLDEKNGSFRAAEAFDLWLDNMVMNCSQTHVTHHEQWKVKKTEWVKTDNLPKVGKFNPAVYLESGEKVLNFIKENVKVGHSYWLYRAPDSSEIMLYNISKIKLKKSEKELLPIFENWKNCDVPHLNVDHLLNYISAICEAMKIKLPLEVTYEPEKVIQIVTKTKNASAKPPSANDVKLKRVDSELQFCYNKVKNKHLLQTSNNLVKDLTHISVTTCMDVIKCIQTVYFFAIDSTPNLGRYIHYKLVEKVFKVCSTLLLCIGPTSETNKDLKFWEGTYSMRSWVTGYGLGMCEILSNLIDWHSKISTRDIKHELQDEWTYLGFRAHLMHADTMAWLSRRNIVELMPPKIDQDFPFSTDYHASIINNYKKALSLLFQIPKSKSFSVSEKYGQSGNTTIEREVLVGEVYWKLSRAYIINAEFILKYPAYVRECEPPQASISFLTSSHGLHQPDSVYRQVTSLVRHSLDCISKLQSTDGLHQISRDLIMRHKQNINHLLEEIQRNAFYVVTLPEIGKKIRTVIDVSVIAFELLYDTVYITENFKVLFGGIHEQQLDEVVATDVNEIEKRLSYFEEATRFNDGTANPPKSVKDLLNFLAQG